VVLYGEIYLPIFERLHKELIASEGKEHTESLAIQLAKKYAALEETE